MEVGVTKRLLDPINPKSMHDAAINARYDTRKWYSKIYISNQYADQIKYADLILDNGPQCDKIFSVNGAFKTTM